jgi:hypothetical protein
MHKKDSRVVSGQFLFLTAMEETLEKALKTPSLTSEDFNALHSQFRGSIDALKKQSTFVKLASLMKEKDLDLSIDHIVDLSTSNSKPFLMRHKNVIKMILPKIYQLLSQESLSHENRSLLNIAIKKMASLYFPKNRNKNEETAPSLATLKTLLVYLDFKASYKKALQLFEVGKALFDGNIEDAHGLIQTLTQDEKVLLVHHLNALISQPLPLTPFMLTSKSFVEKHKMDIVRSLLAIAWEISNRCKNTFYYTNFEIRQLFNEAQSLDS